jgi:hypothetical protein
LVENIYERIKSQPVIGETVLYENASYTVLALVNGPESKPEMIKLRRLHRNDDASDELSVALSLIKRERPFASKASIRKFIKEVASRESWPHTPWKVKVEVLKKNSENLKLLKL